MRGWEQTGHGGGRVAGFQVHVDGGADGIYWQVD